MGWVWIADPPADNDMSTTYQPTLAAYNSHAAHSFPASIGNGSSSTKAAAVDSRIANQNRYLPHHVPSSQSATSNRGHYLGSKNTSASLQMTSNYRNHLDTFTPTTETTMPVQSMSAARRGSETLIYHSLQVPKCISPTGGNLADFAAQVCRSGCLLEVPMY